MGINMSEYAYVTLSGPDLAADVAVAGINDDGIVVGSFTDLAEQQEGFIYNPSGEYTLLTGPDAPGSDYDVVPTGINLSGTVIGYFASQSDAGGFIYDPDTQGYTLLYGPDGDGVDENILPVAINASGEVLLTYGTLISDITGSEVYGRASAIFNPATDEYTTLAGPPEPSGYSTEVVATGLNDSGDVVGNVLILSGPDDDEASELGGFIYDSATSTYAGLLSPGDAGPTSLYGINDSGEIIGSYGDPFGGGEQTAFTYVPAEGGGTFTDLNVSGSLVTPVAINAEGDVAVDLMADSVYASAAAIYDPDGAFTTLSASCSGIIGEAEGINDSGEVITHAQYAYVSPTQQYGEPAAYVAEPLCFLRGTNILTHTGEVCVEALNIGDLVVTRFNGMQPVKWIGRQSYAAHFVQKDQDKLPVRIGANALGNRFPLRDLYVSPGHSMLLGGSLVLARCLVNGITITQGPAPRQIDYFSVELEDHDCVAAQGAWSETYADAPGQRAQFHNAAEYFALYPDAPPPDELRLCVPRPESGPKLDAALRPVVARAAGNAAPGPLEGYIEIVTEWRVEGWVRDVENPELPILLEIVLDGKVIGTVLACDFRGDLKAATKGNGRCAFRFKPPARLPAELLPCLHIRRAADGAAIHARHIPASARETSRHAAIRAVS